MARGLAYIAALLQIEKNISAHLDGDSVWLAFVELVHDRLLVVVVCCLAVVVYTCVPTADKRVFFIWGTFATIQIGRAHV